MPTGKYNKGISTDYASVKILEHIENKEWKIVSTKEIADMLFEDYSDPIQKARDVLNTMERSGELVRHVPPTGHSHQWRLSGSEMDLRELDGLRKLVLEEKEKVEDG